MEFLSLKGVPVWWHRLESLRLSHQEERNKNMGKLVRIKVTLSPFLVDSAGTKNVLLIHSFIILHDIIYICIYMYI